MPEFPKSEYYSNFFRYQPPLATPINSTYGRDFKESDKPKPSQSMKQFFTTTLPPITYFKYLGGPQLSTYNGDYNGKLGLAANTAKPAPYQYPSKDKFKTSIYRSDFIQHPPRRALLAPTSAGRKNNPHPPRLTRSYNFPDRGYWVWPADPLKNNYNEEHTGDRLLAPSFGKIYGIQRDKSQWREQEDDHYKYVYKKSATAYAFSTKRPKFSFPLERLQRLKC